MEEAAYLIEGRPPGGWDTLVTKEYLDLKLEAIDSKFDARLESLERRMQRHVNRLVLWLVPTVFAGMAAAGALVGVTS